MTEQAIADRPSKSTGRRTRKPKLAIPVDERTDELSDAALICRASRHLWESVPLGSKRFTELFQQGLTEDRWECGNGCGSTWRQVWDLRTGEVVENDRKYPSKHSTAGQYLIKPGNGRLPRGEARKARFARSNSSLVAILT